MNFFSPSYDESPHLQTAEVTCKIIVALHLAALATAVHCAIWLEKKSDVRRRRPWRGRVIAPVFGCIVNVCFPDRIPASEHRETLTHLSEGLAFRCASLVMAWPNDAENN